MSFASDAAGSPSVSSRWSMRSAIACRRNATANVATSIVAADCVRSGRKTTRSIAIESAITTAKQRTIPTQTGQSRSDANASAKAPAMTSWP